MLASIIADKGGRTLFRFHHGADFKTYFSEMENRFKILQKSPLTKWRWHIVELPELQLININLGKGSLDHDEARRRIAKILFRLCLAKNNSKLLNSAMHRNIYVVNRLFDEERKRLRLVGGSEDVVNKRFLYRAATAAGPNLLEVCNLRDLRFHLDKMYGHSPVDLSHNTRAVNMVLNWLGRGSVSSKPISPRENVLVLKRRD